MNKPIHIFIHVSITIFIVYLIYQFSTNDILSYNPQTYINNYYLTTFTGLLFLSLLLPLVTKFNNPEDVWKETSVLIIFLLTYLISSTYSYGNEYFCHCMTMYICFYLVLFLSPPFYKLIFISLVLSAFYQAWVASEQAWNYKSNIVITGTLKNSGTLVIYLVISIPILRYVFFDLFSLDRPSFMSNLSGINHQIFYKNIKTVKYICYYSLLLIIFYIIICARSRNAIIIFCLILSYNIFQTNKIIIRK